MSQLEVNKVIPQGAGTALQIGESGDTVTLPSGTTLTLTNATVNLPTGATDGSSLTTLNGSNISSGTVANARLAGSGTLTINGSSVALGGSVTIPTETRPTFSTVTPSTIENTQTTVTIAGTNFVSIPLVTAINSSTGAQFIADEVSFTSSTSITAKFTISTDGTYLLYIENPDGNALQTSADTPAAPPAQPSPVETVSDAPAWVTSAGSLGTFAAGANVGTLTITCTDATSFSITSGALPGGLSLNTAATNATITGTESGATSATTYNFTVTATDAQAQTSDRAFSIAITVGQLNSLRFA